MTLKHQSSAPAAWIDQTTSPSDAYVRRAWEEQFEAIEGVSRVHENDFVRLKRLLENTDNPDSYLTSPTYYSFTGRRGLWVFEKNDAFLFICWHPNADNQILVFPQLAGTKNNLLSDLLNIIPTPSGGVLLARIKNDVAVQDQDLHFKTRKILLRKVDETVLDWRYPVHILSTNTVASLEGHKFMKIRNHIRQTQKRSVDVLPFDGVNHSRSLENLLHRWANYNAASREEYDLLYAPYEALFSASLEKPPGLSGQMIFVDGDLQAVGLWDVSNIEKTANIYVNFCNTDIPGLSEFAMVKTCETLFGQGTLYLNLGGSETATLDAYKRKFLPAVSLKLCSVEAHISESLANTTKKTLSEFNTHLVFTKETTIV